MTEKNLKNNIFEQNCIWVLNLGKKKKKNQKQNFHSILTYGLAIIKLTKNNKKQKSKITFENSIKNIIHIYIRICEEGWPVVRRKRRRMMEPCSSLLSGSAGNSCRFSLHDTSAGKRGSPLLSMFSSNVPLFPSSITLSLSLSKRVTIIFFFFFFKHRLFFVELLVFFIFYFFGLNENRKTCERLWILIVYVCQVKA